MDTLNGMKCNMIEIIKNEGVLQEHVRIIEKKNLMKEKRKRRCSLKRKGLILDFKQRRRIKILNGLA